MPIIRLGRVRSLIPLETALPIPLLDSASARSKALAACVAAIVAIAVVDWKVKPNVSLGFLYVLPVMVLASFASQRRIVMSAVACSVLRELL